MICDNLLCTRQNCCAFPLQCTLDVLAPISVTVTTISSKLLPVCQRSICDGSRSKCINEGNPSDCVFLSVENFPASSNVVTDASQPKDIFKIAPRESASSFLTDADLVAKIERGGVVLAEDLNELVARFKAYSKLS